MSPQQWDLVTYAQWISKLLRVSDCWMPPNSPLTPAFLNEDLMQVSWLCFPIICWARVEEDNLSVFHSHVCETEMLHPKNYAWRNVFSFGLSLDEEILILRNGPGPDVTNWNFGERGECILLEGRNCGQRAECVFSEFITKMFLIPHAGLQCDFSLTPLITDSVSLLLETWLTLVPVWPAEYSKIDVMRLFGLCHRKVCIFCLHHLEANNPVRWSTVLKALL